METIYFYSDRIEHLSPQDDFRNPKYYSLGLHHWVHYTYYMLKHSLPGMSLIITNKIPDEGIIFFHKGHFPKNIKPSSKQLFCCMQVDYGRHKYAQLHIVHNPYQGNSLFVVKKRVLDLPLRFCKTLYTPGWQQMQIKSRDVDRKADIKNIRFYGNVENLAPELQSEEWLSFCKEQNLSFNVISDPQKWNDFSSTDIVIAIRDFSNKHYYNKPYLKVTNGIHAGCIVISGPESSSQYLDKKIPGLFYIVRNLPELKQQLVILKNNAEKIFFDLQTAKEKISFTCDQHIKENWEKILLTAIDSYKYWQKRRLQRKLFFILRDRF